MSQVVEGTSQNNVASLYVGDLKPDITEQSLWNVFSNFGQVVSVRLCRDALTQNSLRYAYVNFRTVLDAEKAIKHGNFSSIDGRPCRVMWSMRDSNRRKLGVGNLFIKNLHPGVDSRNLYDAFSVFGNILSCKVAVDEYGASKGHGFVQFCDEKDADAARLKSDGISFRGKKLVVANFVPKSQRSNARTVDPSDFTNVFVKNFGTDWKDNDLREKFSEFGQITSCVVATDAEEKTLGYGFINFSSPGSAKAAVEKMNGFEISEGKKLFVGRAQKKSEREAYLRSQYEKRKKDIQKKYQEQNLYVKNFDESLTDERLHDLFSPFGSILSCHIMKDDQGKSKGFGFVCFRAPEEAKAAIEALHTKVVDSKPLFVCLAQSKEDRKKMLDQKVYSGSFRPPVFQSGALPFMYTPHNPLAYPAPPFQRFPGVPNPRQQMRASQPPIMHGQGYQQPPVRASHNINPNYPSQPFYSQQPSYRPRGGPRYPPHHSVVGNVPPRGANVQNQAVSVNTVSVESSAKPKREDHHRPAAHHKAVPVDPRVAFKDKVYKLAQTVFAEKNFGMEKLPSVAGLVIDCYSNSTQLTADDPEIVQAITSAYQTLMEKLGTDDPSQL